MLSHRCNQTRQRLLSVGISMGVCTDGTVRLGMLWVSKNSIVQAARSIETGERREARMVYAASSVDIWIPARG